MLEKKKWKSSEEGKKKEVKCWSFGQKSKLMSCQQPVFIVMSQRLYTRLPQGIQFKISAG